MRSLVFSKFFKSVASRFRADQVLVFREGIEVMDHGSRTLSGSAWFDWPDGVSFDGALVTVKADALRSVLELAEAHGGLRSVDCERLPVERDADGKEVGRPAMMHVRFADDSGYDCEGAACDVQYDPRGVRSNCCQGDPLFAVTMDSGEFARAFKLVEPCVSKEEQRPVLTAVDMDVAGGMLRLQSTDRFRMAVACVRGAVIEHDGGDGFDCFARAKFLKLFAEKTIGNVRMECRKDVVSPGEDTIVFDCEVGGWHVLASSTMRGEYPNLDCVRHRSTAGYDCGFVCDVKQLRDVVAKLKTSKSNGLTFSVAANGIAVANELGVSYQVPAIGCGKADPNAADGRVLTVILNAHMLGELLARVAALGASVEFLACNAVKPVWIGPVVDAGRPFDVTGLDGEGYLLVPMCPNDMNGGYHDVPVQLVDGFKPRASKIEPVAGLADGLEWTFAPAKSKRSKREPIKPEQPEPVKPETEPEPEPVKPVEPEPAETVEQSKQPMSDLGGHTIVEFAREFEAIYTMLHDSDVSPADYGEAVTAFADGEYPVSVLEAFNDYREDYVSSDREAAAFMMALQSRAMQPEAEPVTAEIPEVPPRTEPHEVVAASSAVMVRKAVIPGGKSVRELSDVFGAYAHKPRGFRDSKGRRVAYVVFDGTGGVVAYRDCYTDVDARLEEQIADYLAAHNLRLAA